MTYDYIRKMYEVDPKVGGRVVHTVTKKHGTIARENKSQGHYVQVKFDGQGYASPCHPTELEYADNSLTKPDDMGFPPS